MVGLGERQFSADRDEDAHVEGAAYDGPATGNGPATAQGAAVAVEGSDAGEGGDLASIEPTELGHLSEQGAGDLGSDTGHADQQVFSLPPGRGSAHGDVDVVVDLFELGLQGSEHAIDALEGPSGSEQAAAIAFGDHHLDELAPSGHQLAEQSLLGVGKQPGPADAPLRRSGR